jgi:preprotein translocase subunit SecG
MYNVIIVIHVLLGLGIIGLIMIQQGKGADAGASFGSGSSGSVFGSQGAGSFLTRMTSIFAALFFTTSLGLAVLNSHQGAAYDLMSQQEPATAETDINKAADSTLPEVKTEQAPVVAPAVVAAEPAVPATEIKEEKATTTEPVAAEPKK